jgi:hypothetical protein
MLLVAIGSQDIVLSLSLFAVYANLIRRGKEEVRCQLPEKVSKTMGVLAMDLPSTLSEHHRLAIFSTIVIIALLAWVARQASSPISRLPGTFLTKFSVLPAVIQDHRSNRTSWTLALHEKYGPIVRLSPDEVSIYSPESIRDVFNGSAKTGYYAKAPLFNIFQHFGARNAFSSMETEAHSWRRKIVAGNYAQTAIISKETKYGHIWDRVGAFVGLVEREGVQTIGKEDKGSKSIDFFSACRFYSADNVSGHLFVVGTHALDGNRDHRRFIEASAERPGEVTSYFAMYYETLHLTLRKMRRSMNKLLGKKKNTGGRARAATASGKKVEAESNGWYGGTEIRDWGFKQFVKSRKALETGDLKALPEDPVSARLAVNAVAGEKAGKEAPMGDDTGVRLVGDTLFYRNEGCASECMDQFLAGIDTSGDTLSYTLQLLSAPESQGMQELLRKECARFGLPTSYDQPLSLQALNAVQSAPYLEAILKETLRRYPASTTSLQRVVPPGGRFLDGLYVPGGVVIGATPVSTNNDAEVFDAGQNYDVNEWRPERWLEADADILSRMNHRLWTFGSGGRGCIGKQSVR